MQVSRWLHVSIMDLRFITPASCYYHGGGSIEI